VVPARAVHVVRHRCCTELCKEPKSVRQPNSFFKKKRQTSSIGHNLLMGRR
jgi:hypothetical protein